MWTDRTTVISLTVIGSLLGLAITLSRKFLTSKFSPASIMYIDSVLTGLMIVGIAIYQAGFPKLNRDLSKLDATSAAAFVLGSLAIAISAFTGLNLLKHNELSYLTMLETGIELLATAVVGMVFLGEEVSRTKIFGLGVLCAGIYILHM